MQLTDFHHLPSTSCVIGRPSVNFPCGRGPSINFHQHSMRPRNLPLTSDNIPCGRETLCTLPSALCAAGKHSVMVCQLSVQLGHLSSSSVNFPCHLNAFCPLPSTFSVTGRPSVNFVSLLCCRETFNQVPSIFREVRRPFVSLPFCRVPSVKIFAAGRSSVNFRQLSMQLRDLLSTFVNFLCGWETFHQVLSTFRKLLSTFCAAVDIASTSVNFRAARKPFINFRQLSIRLGALRELPSTFRDARSHSVNYHHHSLPLGDIP